MDNARVGYAIIFGVALVARLVVATQPIAYLNAGQGAAWSWRFFIAFAICFLIAVAMASRSRIPTPAQTLSRPSALAIACAVGLGVAGLTIWTDVLAPASQARGLPTMHIAGWVAVPFYAYGAILFTTVFHFLPMAFAAWLTQRLHGGLRLVIIGTAIAVVGMSEDASYFLHTNSLLDVDTARHGLSVLANAAEAVFIYRFGFLAGLAQRSATYLLWHILWPLFGRS